MGAREDIAGLVADPATEPMLRAELEQATAMLDFAASELALPDNGSYRAYVDIGRPYVVVNVVATPELSLDPVTWCFPVAGCVSYRGYFDLEEARVFALGLADAGYDVTLSPATAYSTLGWFNDPLPSTILARGEVQLAGTLFHELSHQRVYVAGDSMFNESYAVTVEREGVRRWLRAHGGSAAIAAYDANLRREAAFLDLILGARAELDALYRSSASDEEKHAGKAAIFAALRRDYARLKASWGGYAGYDGWFERDLNNAHLAAIGTYEEHVAAFEALLRREGGDMAAFHAAVEALAALPRVERDAALAALERG
ncbi:MAG: aminopeptidase [Bauldia sp.]|nr:aminopeptidase [Bauldia sp.]